MAQKNKLHGIELTGTEEPTLQWQDGATGLHGDENSVKFYAEGTPVIDLGGAGDSTDLELKGAHNSAFGRSRVMLTGCRGSLDNPQYLLKDDAIGTINAGELMPDDTVRAVGNLRFVADQNHGAAAADSRLDVGLVPNVRFWKQNTHRWQQLDNLSWERYSVSRACRKNQANVS